MSNHFTTVKIENFKSIREMKFDCRRINLFIGEPNVGKSNILEALGLFSAPYSSHNIKPSSKESNYFGWDQIRYKDLADIFFFQNTGKPIVVKTDKGIAHFELRIPEREEYEFYITATEEQLNTLKASLGNSDFQNKLKKVRENSITEFLPNYYLNMDKDGDVSYHAADRTVFSYAGFVKKYLFNSTLFKSEKHHSRFSTSLLPSYGSNLFTILQGNPQLGELVTGLFKKYDRELVFIQNTAEYVIQRKLGSVANQPPYDSIADTLQRIIFHFVAIRSNKDSVLLFEEPEAHTFPTYVTQIAQEIIDSETNQFFIASLSPYLVEKIIENAPADDVAVFVCNYEQHQTTVRELTSEELSDIKKYNYDIIYNVSSFEK